MKSPSILLSIVAAVTMTFGLSTSSGHAQQCSADVNGDYVVNGQDLAILLSSWGKSDGSGGADFNGDGTIDALDLAIILSAWGSCGPLWATVLEWEPNAAVVTDATLRDAITASGLPWRIRDNATNIEMLLVPGGTFIMGCSASTQGGCFSNESPTHQVTLSAFYMGRYEVTQAQWTAKMGSNPSFFSRYSDSPSRPVERVSWSMIADADGFMSGTGLRLPSEAEWEYAYRAGTTTAFHSYPVQANGFSNDTLLVNIAWYNSNSGSQTHAVGGKFANALGLHDMSGNIWEWCQDWFDETYYASSPAANPTGPTTGTSRLLRGGSLGVNSRLCRASERAYSAPGGFSSNYGFRVVRAPDESVAFTGE